MRVVASVCFRDELLVEPSLVRAGFVSGDEYYRVASRIEGKRHTPDATPHSEAELFHVRVLRTVQRVDSRSSKPWAQHREQLRMREQFILHIRRELVELWQELAGKLDDPGHPANMYFTPYPAIDETGGYAVESRKRSLLEQFLRIKLECRTGVTPMRDSARYVKIVEWSDEDQCYVGSAPGLVYGGCHGLNERAVFAELCEIVDEVIALYKADGRELPPRTSGRDLANKLQHVA